MTGRTAVGRYFRRIGASFSSQFEILIGNQGSPHKKLSFYLDPALVERLDESLFGLSGQVGKEGADDRGR